MSIMDKMMDKMINKMSPEEKERMMLKMMPLMTKDVDMTQMMAKMMPEMLKAMSALDVYNLLKKGIAEFIETRSRNWQEYSADEKNQVAQDCERNDAANVSKGDADYDGRPHHGQHDATYDEGNDASRAIASLAKDAQ